MARVEPIANIRTRGVQSNEELRRANDLMAKSHRSNYFQAIQWFETCGPGYPNFQRDHTRVAFYNGELAGALRLSTDTIRLGEARLKMGGLGWVTTAPYFRHRGVCSALMNDTLRYMRDHGYHVSMLFGIPNFYHRFGYVTTLANYAVTLDTSEIARVKGTNLRVREAKPGDIRAIQKIHAADDNEVPCSILRTAGHITNRWEAFRMAHVFTTEHGKVVAYMRSREEKSHIAVQEIGVSNPSQFDDVLEFTAKLANDLCVGIVRFLVPSDHAFSRYLRRFNSIYETNVVREEGGMMAFAHIAETLESMIPEWEQLLSRSALTDTHTEVTFLIDRRPYRVRAHRGAIDVAEYSGANKCSVTQEELIQLITGYRHADDLLDAKRRLMTEESRELVRVMMPKRNPYVWTFDRF